MKPSYTPAEKRERAWLMVRTSKQALADAVDPRLEARLDAIEDRALERAQREADALWWRLETAKNAAADARAAERTACRADKTAARQAVKDARMKVQRIQREVDRHGR